MANLKMPKSRSAMNEQFEENPSITSHLQEMHPELNPVFCCSAGNYQLYDIDHPEHPEAINFLVHNPLSEMTKTFFIMPMGMPITRESLDEPAEWHNVQDLPLHVKDAMFDQVPQDGGEYHDDDEAGENDSDDSDDHNNPNLTHSDDDDQSDHESTDDRSNHMHESKLTGRAQQMARKKLINEDEDMGAQAVSPAAATLRPMGGSGGTETRAQMLDTFVQLLTQLGTEDLSNIFNAVQAQYGPGLVQGVDDAAAQNNMMSISAKPSSASVWKEDVNEMFAGDDLSEEFREKATVIFEAAVNTRVAVELTRLEEDFNAKFEELGSEYASKVVELETAFDNSLQEETAKVLEETTNKLDAYLDHVVKEWLKENRLAIDNGIRSELAENFIQGLHTLFAEHYITVPEGKVDILGEMRAELEDAKRKLNESLDENIRLSALVESTAKDQALAMVSEGLTASQSERLKMLAEGVEFVDPETFVRKVGILKEKYFGDATVKKASTGLIVESIDGNSNTFAEAPAVRSDVAKYVQAISKSVK